MKVFGCPVIGDRVSMRLEAKIFGAITISNDVAIGTNALAMKDSPNQGVAVDTALCAFIKPREPFEIATKRHFQKVLCTP